VSIETGKTQNLAPFQLDSLSVNYEIPQTAGNQTDSIRVVLSISGKYADTTYSYLKAYTGGPLSVKDQPPGANNLFTDIFPNPNTGTVRLGYQISDIRYLILDFRFIFDFRTED